MWLSAFIAAAAAAALVLLRQYAAARKTHRPLASRQPQRRNTAVPLGMEATDLESVARTTRRNESLERGQTNWLTKSGFFGRADTDVAPLADDETYAARYHAAFQTQKSKD